VGAHLPAASQLQRAWLGLQGATSRATSCGRLIARHACAPEAGPLSSALGHS